MVLHAVGADIGKRRLALGSPRRCLSEDIDLLKPGMSRYLELAHMRAWLADVAPLEAHLFAEQPFAGRGGVAAAQGLSETLGMVMAAGFWADVTVVHQSTWKANLLGNHLASKEETSAWLRYHFPEMMLLTGPNEDRVDAMCIGIYGQKVLDGEIVVEKKAKKRRRRVT